MGVASADGEAETQAAAPPTDTRISVNPQLLAPRLPDVEVGAVIGPYVLEALIGVGSTGLVFQSAHQTLGRRVALKCLHADQTRDPMLVARFLQEARLVNQINHPHIIQVHDFVEAPGEVYAVMELLHGETLGSRHEKQGLCVAQVFDVCRQLADALGAAHALGVVHRDLKPENIFLCSDQPERDWVKVLDFGVAKLLTPHAHSVLETQLGTVVGTPRYMSPEQVTGSPVDSRADIYAFGVVLYELLSGEPPFESLVFAQLATDILTRPPPPLPELTPRGEPVPPVLAQLAMDCLAKNREDRVASMAEVRQRLDGTALVLKRSPRSRAALASHLGVVTLAVALLSTAMGTDGATTVAQATPELPRALASPLGPVPTLTTVALVSTPPGAVVSNAVTGAALGVTPLELTLPRGHEELTLQLELGGHAPERRVLRLDENQHLELSLKPLARPGPKKRRAISEGVLDAY
ncbi:MAG: serine/threonine-protein kinase [Myxococcales bacterium]|nr:serine/threonine-protein kinase [Myxococcales bacterium]